MINSSRYVEIEEQLTGMYLQTARAEFVRSLQDQIYERAAQQALHPRKSMMLRPGWVVTALVLLALVIGFFAIGPARVYATFQRLLGYVPGVGVVDTSTSIRVLKEPVSQTREGVTITVSSGVLTADRTHLEIQAFGVPRSAYPNSESVHGCMNRQFLLLPDGSQLEPSADFPPIPADVNTATLVIPCISETLPGSVPEDWYLPLEFVAAPADMTVMPVEEITPTQTLSPQQTPVATETVAPLATIAVTQVINTENGYILVVAFTPSEEAWVQRTGAVSIIDAAGKNVAYSLPLDVLNSLQSTDPYTDQMAYKLSAIGVTFPLTIHYPGVRVSQPDPTAEARLTFDAGENPQQGQEWQLNQTVELAGHSITLVSVDADSRGGYDFRFKTDDPHVSGASVTIEGYSPVGGGGGGGGALTNGEFSVSQAYASLPSGKLTLVISHLTLVSDPLDWTAQWSPQDPQAFSAVTPQLPAGTCADSSTVSTYPLVPASFTGQALMYEQLENSDQWGLLLYNLDGSGKKQIAANANWGTLTRDGSKVVYSAEDGFHLYEPATDTTRVLSVNGYDPVWSNAGDRFIYIDNFASGVALYDLSTDTSRQIASTAYTATIGWSADDTQGYVAVMAAGGSAWQVEALDLKTGSAQPLFIIEDGSYKSLDAALSPDGQWLAYRGRENSSVYLVRMDGSDKRLLLDSPAVGTAGIVWAANDWLAVSLLSQFGNDARNMILVNPFTCAGYSLPALTGTLQSIQVK